MAALKKITKKVDAVTILESVIATTVLMILFGILIGVYTKILPVTYTMRHVRAEHMLQSMMGDVKQHKFYFNHTEYQDPYTIERSIRTTEQEDVIVIELVAKDAADSIVARCKDLVYIQK